LQHFVKERIERYKTDRDSPATAGTSTLSPYLASGVISARQCLESAVAANNGRVDSGKTGVVTWISELIWREFYRHILMGYPRVCRHQPFRLETKQIEWDEDDAHFEAWCAGRTGFPIVDAGMRQLARTGWMHNRVRMITAMFLTKDLFIDWRRGEAHFMRHLVDGDLASNNGGWQWSASTGTDAAPYFRIFNPYSQSRKCDPTGDYIRKFVPELAGLDDDSIHQPEPLAADANDYPQPIVDRTQTKERVMAAFKAIKS
jgi:deoxyribodipyrimidine photo-lyase